MVQSEPKATTGPVGGVGRSNDARNGRSDVTCSYADVVRSGQMEPRLNSVVPVPLVRVLLAEGDRSLSSMSRMVIEHVV
jgi:hypothetical protein